MRLPTGAEEAFRDLLRAREDAREDLMRQRQRLSRFLSRRGPRCPGGTKAGTREWMRWLGELSLDELAAGLTLGDHLARGRS